MQKNLLLVFSIFMVAVCIGSCQHDPFTPTKTDNKPKPYTGACSPDSTYFKNTIGPLLYSSCGESGCHDIISANRDIVIINYQTLMDSHIINPGHSELSGLYNVITEKLASERMPESPKPPLTPGQIKLIKDWIDQGAKNNACTAECDSSSFTYAADVRPILDIYCVGCHNGPNPQGNKELVTYDGVKKFAQDGRLLGSMVHEVGIVAMPYKTDKMPDCEIAIVRKWIEDGAQNN